MQTASRVFCLLLPIVATGCRLFQEEDFRRHIAASSLNHIEILYVPGSGQAPVQVALLGSGHIGIKRGTSPLLRDVFSQDVKDKRWNDLDVDQATIDPEEMNAMFQTLSDRGLFRKPDPAFAGGAAQGAPHIRVVGRLNGERVDRVACEPELVDVVRRLVARLDASRPSDRRG